jgi:hypothetical protein
MKIIINKKYFLNIFYFFIFLKKRKILNKKIYFFEGDIKEKNI